MASARAGRPAPRGLPGWRRWLLAACLVALAGTCHAALRVHAQRLVLPGVQLADVTLDAALAANGRPEITLQAARVDVPMLGWRAVAVSLHGQPQQAQGNAWKFTGNVALEHAPGNALADSDLVVVYDPDGGTLEVDVGQAKTSLHALLPLDQASHVQLQLNGLPLEWLRGVLAAAWPAGRLQGGSLAGTVALDLGDGGTRASGRVAVHGANLDNKGGDIAAQKLDADGTFRIEKDLASASLMFDGRLQGGELLLGPLYARLPAQAANLHVAATLGPTGVSIGSLDFDDHDSLRISGSLSFDASGKLEKLAFERFAATFPAAYSRYGTTLLQGLAGLSGLDTSGALVGTLALDGNGLAALHMTAEDFSLDSHGGGLAVAGLAGSVDWRAGASRPPTNLGWHALSLYKVAFGPARLAFADRAGNLTLAAPVEVPVFGGGFQLNRFAWSPRGGTGARLSAGFAVTNVDMAKLCKAFGWPEFGGKLGGAVPDLRYGEDSLVFDGGLSINVFDGAATVTNLAMQHPFGAQPALAADIDLQQLDLAQLTGIFDFGEITGRLDGQIHGLRLVGWRPTAFAAELATRGDGKISQHAIKSLTEVGGGGIAGGLQGMALRLFKTFGYARIGLGCTLREGICSMHGIVPDPDPDADGYTIVEGRGLPRITVIGHQRAVDWATLVSRLEAVTHGARPVIK